MWCWILSKLARALCAPTNLIFHGSDRSNSKMPGRHLQLQRKPARHVQLAWGGLEMALKAVKREDRYATSISLYRRMLAFWLIVGLAPFLMVATRDGSFQPLPSGPPAAHATNWSIVANANWVIAAIVVYGPLLLIIAVPLWRWVEDIIREDRLDP
jgi:hypothetical protein